MSKYANAAMLVFLSVFLAVGLSACNNDTAHAAPGPSLAPNQTLGFADGSHDVKFTYTQNYDCVDEPGTDLDYNGKKAQKDTAEFQIPICQAANEPTIDPTGANAKDTAILYVLVPMFGAGADTNPDDAIQCGSKGHRFTHDALCGPELGKTLNSLFGGIPEAFRENPSVYTDCPTPGEPAGTCTMHASTVDLGKVLNTLMPGKGFKETNVFLPTPNHSHVIANDEQNTKAIWWQVRPVLVTEPSSWPKKDGSGITSVTKLQQAETNGVAIEVPSNFYLFFKSEKIAGMSGMTMN